MNDLILFLCYSIFILFKSLIIIKYIAANKPKCRNFSRINRIVRMKSKSKWKRERTLSLTTMKINRPNKWVKLRKRKKDFAGRNNSKSGNKKNKSKGLPRRCRISSRISKPNKLNNRRNRIVNKSKSILQSKNKKKINNR